MTSHFALYFQCTENVCTAHIGNFHDLYVFDFLLLDFRRTLKLFKTSFVHNLSNLSYVGSYNSFSTRFLFTHDKDQTIH